MCNENMIFYSINTTFCNLLTMRIKHLQTVHHIQRLWYNSGTVSSKSKHFPHMCILKKQFTGKLIIFFIESSTGYENSYCHNVKLDNFLWHYIDQVSIYF